MKRSTHKWSRACVLALVGCTGAMAVSGIAALFLENLPSEVSDALRAMCVLAFAGVALFALLVAQAATGMAQQLKDAPGQGFALGLAVLCFIFCSAVSVVGVHLGWALIRGAPQALPEWWIVDLAGAALGVVKPSMSFIIEACDKVDADKARAERDAERDAEFELRKLTIEQSGKRVETPIRIETPTPPPPKRASAGASRTAANALRRSHPAPAPAPRPKPHLVTGDRGSLPFNEDDLRRAMTALARRGESLGAVNTAREIAAQRGCAPFNRSRVQRHPATAMIRAEIERSALAFTPPPDAVNDAA